MKTRSAVAGCWHPPEGLDIEDGAPSTAPAHDLLILSDGGSQALPPAIYLIQRARCVDETLCNDDVTTAATRSLDCGDSMASFGVPSVAQCIHPPKSEETRARKPVLG